MKIALRAIVLSAVFGIVTAVFAVRAAAPKTQTVQFAAPDGMVSGFLAVPSTSGKHPALVVIHEWWGRTIAPSATWTPRSTTSRPAPTWSAAASAPSDGAWAAGIRYISPFTSRTWRRAW